MLHAVLIHRVLQVKLLCEIDDMDW